MRTRHLVALSLAALGLGTVMPAGVLAGTGARAAAPGSGSLGPAHVSPDARSASAHGPTVSAALAALLHSGSISTAVYRSDYNVYVAAKRSLGRLGGIRRSELGAVLANVQAIAAGGQLSATRQASMFLTLEQNRHWWTSEPLLSADQRVSFPPSKLIWEYYPGQGIEIQWLASFGEGNGYYNSGHENANLRQLLGEMLALASDRAGGISWDYLFNFDGGAPPWTSGLSQGTALQLLSRAWSRFKEPADLSAARQALGIFELAPPRGVRVPTHAGALYAEYSYAPSDRILNGFIQADVGLYDYASITQDPLGGKLFEAGDAEARAEVPHYDTGAWSLYDQFGESDLNYHELLTEFLQHLCERTRRGAPIRPSTPPVSGPALPAPPASGGATAPAASGSSSPTAAAAAKPVPAPLPGDQVYCETAQRFSADLSTPPAIALLSRTLRTGSRAGVQLSLSKISAVRLSVRQGSRLVWSNATTVPGGTPRLLWVTPSRAGSYSVTLTATDLAGNFSTANGTILLTRR